jgi:drug/metabolite transporter (DMT)-like permease
MLLTVECSAFFQQLIPIMSFLLSVSFGQEPLPSVRARDGFPKYLGLISATIGAIGLVLAGHKGRATAPRGHLRRSLGEFSLFLNCLCTSMYFVMQSRSVGLNHTTFLMINLLM